ncbi:MAG: hypothetical protein ACYCOO_12005, partial [Chitinophagaceae bacterium]
MRSELFKYLKNQFSQEPQKIDRLIVSSFVHTNKIIVKRNSFIKDYIISNKSPNEIKVLIEFLAEFNKHAN